MKILKLNKSQIIDLTKGYYGEADVAKPIADEKSPEERAKEKFFDDIGYMLPDLMRMKKTLVMMIKNAPGDNVKMAVRKSFGNVNKTLKILQGVLDAQIDAELTQIDAELTQDEGKEEK